MGKTKAVLYYVIMVGLICGFIEITAQVAYFLIFKQKYVAEEIYGTIKHRDAGAKFYEDHATGNATEVIHPYVGYVSDFGDKEKNLRTYGFPTLNPPIIKKKADRLNVAILGGSVAVGLRAYIERAFKEVTEVNPMVIGLAVAGHKQPQQALALSYFLSLGAEYDVVINVDGFNEIVIPSADNYRAGVNPFFPMNWHLRVLRRPNKEALSLIGKVTILREAQQQVLESLAHSIFRVSALYGMVRTLQLRIISNDIYKASEKLYKLKPTAENNFEPTGPQVHYTTLSQLDNEAADVWVRSSLLINSLSNDNDIEYYHFLQPNQHFEGSKLLTEEEKKIQYSSYHEAAFRGYPILVEKSKLLTAKEKFFDATMLFAKENGTIYSDDCCHYNVKGNEMLASYIVQKIMEHTKNSKLKGTTK